MTAIDDVPEPTELEYAVLVGWWERGGHPPHRRVWKDGVDVTDDDPSTWPALWRPGATSQSSRNGRSRRR